ncbi:MAG: hypothetical protein KDC11_13125 [Chitinophagaceae bacterium]|nr:hypothetical protein [Chitinophagaceae bacterium]
MEQLFEEANYTVRYERGNFNSGYCILEDKRVAVINKFLDMEGRINALIEILPSLDIKEEELSTEMQKWYKTVQDTVKTQKDNSESQQSEIEHQ